MRPFDKLPDELLMDVIGQATRSSDGRLYPWDHRSAAMFSLPVLRVERYLARFPPLEHADNDGFESQRLTRFLRALFEENRASPGSIIPAVRKLFEVRYGVPPIPQTGLTCHVLDCLVMAGVPVTMLLTLLRKCLPTPLQLFYAGELSWKITSLDDPVQLEIFELVYNALESESEYHQGYQQGSFLYDVFTNVCIHAGPQNWEDAYTFYKRLEVLFNRHSSFFKSSLGVAAVLSGSVELYHKIVPSDVDLLELDRQLSFPMYRRGPYPFPQQVGSAEMTQFLVYDLGVDLRDSSDVLEMWRDRTLTGYYSDIYDNSLWQAGFLIRALDVSPDNFETVYRPFLTELLDNVPLAVTDLNQMLNHEFGLLKRKLGSDRNRGDYLTPSRRAEDVRRLQLLGVTAANIRKWRKFSDVLWEVSLGSDEESSGSDEESSGTDDDGDW